jgi:diguanylate cyclase (GGDEF)-like protein
MFDADDRLVIANARHGDALGLSSADQAVGLHFRDLVERALARGIINREGATRMMAGIKAGIAAGRSGSNVIKLLDGRSLSASFSPIASGGWLVTVEDITERLSAEAQIAHMAHHDALTGLPNRILLRERLGAALALSRRGQSFAVLCLDLDRFKAVNDSLGHAIGDALLCAVAKRMLAMMRESDTAARLGGDEFAIIQTGLREPGDAALLADRLIETLSAPYEFDGHTVSIGTSIGIALLPGGGDDIGTVLHNADQALYRAKFGGRGRYQFHQPELDAASLVPEIEPVPQDSIPG